MCIFRTLGRVIKADRCVGCERVASSVGGVFVGWGCGVSPGGVSLLCVGHVAAWFYGDLEVLPGVTMDCVRVLTSEYAYVPVPVLGRVPLDVAAAVWFVVNIGAALWLYKTLSRGAARFVFWWRLLGLAILPYLLYLEFAVLKAVCIYCTVMHVFILADFVVISIFLRKMAPLIR